MKGASKGQGLGNQFLANIREVSVLLQVVRCFEDENITHVEKSVDPFRDIDIINTELILADLDSLDRMKQKKVSTIYPVISLASPREQETSNWMLLKKP